MQMRPDLFYDITVTVGKGSGAFARTASATTSIRPRTEPVPTGQVSRFCGIDTRSQKPKPCPLRHNPSEPLTVILTPEPTTAAGAALVWYADASAGDMLSKTMGGITKTSLTLLPSGLPAASSVNLYVNMTKVGRPPTPQHGND